MVHKHDSFWEKSTVIEHRFLKNVCVSTAQTTDSKKIPSCQCQIFKDRPKNIQLLKKKVDHVCCSDIFTWKIKTLFFYV